MEQATARAIITDSRPRNEAAASAVSWAAVFGGAAVTAAICLILLSFGAGLGLSSVSVWSNVGASASAIGSAAILWMILMQIMSSAMGGYLAGRLRTKWTAIHSDEVYFRDTAHGFLSWAVALIVTAGFLASAGASMIGSPAARNTSGESRQDGYFVDALFRSGDPIADTNSIPLRTEAALIFAKGLQQGEIPSDDVTYLSKLVMSRTGLNQAEADKRINDVFGKARQAADAVRKSTAHLLLWTFISLLVGAFCASFAATIGGKQRDSVPVA